MDKSPDAFRTISEVAEWLDTPTHVLRFWESRFTQVKPVKRAGGRRYYRPADMELLGGIKKLLHEDGMTIRGVQKLLREEGVRHVAELSPPLDSDAAAELKLVETHEVAEIAVNSEQKAEEQLAEIAAIVATPDPEPAEVIEVTEVEPSSIAPEPEQQETGNGAEKLVPDMSKDADNDAISSLYERLKTLRSRMSDDTNA